MSLDMEEDQNAEEAPHAGGERSQAASGGRARFAGSRGRRRSSLDRRYGGYLLSLRQEFGGLKSDQVKRLKDLKAENARLRRAFSDLTLDKIILAEAAKGDF